MVRKLIIIILFFTVALQPCVFAQSASVENENIPSVDPNENLEMQKQVGAIDVISGQDLARSTEYSASNSLAGLASGLYVSKSSWGTGTGWSTIKVRGLSRGNTNDGPLIVVDGIPNRSLTDISVESIESIQILKDVNSKMLYGSQAANGVIVVKTKRGFVSNRVLSFSVETGMRKPHFIPEYLNAYDYAVKYNEARVNDGLEPLYNNEALGHYQNNSAPLLFPDMDYYGTFLKDYANLQRINSTLTGGTETTRYFLNLEFVHESGLEAVGKLQQFNQINLISNLDYKVNDIISMNLDISSRIGLHNGNRLGQSAMFTAMSEHRPNSYPFFVTENQEVDTDQLAYNTKGAYNLYGQVTRSGYLKRQDFKSQTTLGINFDLNDYVEGLSAKAIIGFDSYNNIYTGKDLNYATYRIVNADSLVRVGEDEVKSTEARFLDDFYRNMAGKGVIKYVRTFDKHSLNVKAEYSARRLAYKSVEDQGQVKQDYKGLNAGLNLNYAFDNRYVAELVGSYMGSDKFEKGNRFKPFGSFGAAWILSNEQFFADINTVNFLKLKGSFGVMGYDADFDYYIYQNAFSGAGAFYFGINNDGNIDYASRTSKIGNPEVTFEVANELNLGLEAVLLDNALTFEANYFNNLRTGMPTRLRSTLPGYVQGVAPIGNYNEVRNSGFDLAINYQKEIGDLILSLGGNLMYSKSVYEKFDEINFYQHLNRTGKPTDVLFGLMAEGLYSNEQEIIEHGVSSSFGEIIPGDIRYVDYTNDLNDNVIDEYDLTDIGHWFPRFNYALNLNLEFKGFELYALGQGIADVDVIQNSSYFFNYGERKYSSYVLNEDYPRLTTATSGGHSFRNSTFWMVDGSYFKLRILELSYTLPESVAMRLNSKSVKLFIKGTDLLTWSNLNKLDPEDMNAGITKYPSFATGSIGAKIIF